MLIDPHLLVSQEDIIQEDQNDIVDDTVPQDQPRITERPTTVFVEQKGKYCTLENFGGEIIGKLMDYLPKISSSIFTDIPKMYLAYALTLACQ